MTDRAEGPGFPWESSDPELPPTVQDPDLQTTLRDVEGDDDDYTATALDDHWVSGPQEHADDDGLLRFGPGVPPMGVGEAAARVWHGAPPDGGQQKRQGRLRWLRRYRLAGVVLVLAALYVFWPRHTADLRVTGVTAHTAPVLGCDRTAELVAVVSTNGESGTIVYQWNRSDGTSSAPLEERLGEGQRETRLRLLWTFHGVGTNKATAKLIITSPARHIVSASFTYRCHERGG
ncbi:hypothetical protein [Streptomyces sp. NPDC055287]